MAEPKYSIHKAAGIIIKDRKLLVTRETGKHVFIAPGGKVEGDNTILSTLERELEEELKIAINQDDLKLFGVFYAEAATYPGEYLRMDVFLVEQWEGEPTPDNEVEELEWVSSDNPRGLKIGSIFEHEVIPRLVEKELID